MNLDLKAFIDSTLFQIFLFCLVGVVFGAILATLSLVVQKVFGIGKKRQIKSQVYECGMRPLGKSNVQFDIKYYVFALMFIVFDVEFVFLVPWALSMNSFKSMSAKLFILTEAFIFIAILGVGLYYAWKKGALEWE
ncbi:MAG: NADH-quinone oxidoreductase subunit A [Candidatus Caenarcaniphilales bacterium]|nr:NADH-quinone oxidoreductase subunit A [Candidatus Caenarcaniphilales bacterium]